MAGPQIIPEKVTSPFQLMAAWFVMLVLLSTVFLTAASKIEKPDWAAGYLIVFTSLLAVLVIGCVTLMLTKFRPHLQDGKEYAQWLKDKGRYSSGVIVKEPHTESIRSRAMRDKAVASSNLITNVAISVVNTYDSNEMLEHLKLEGFSADIYAAHTEPYESHSGHESIWLGSRIDPSIACRVIKSAIKKWPHLKYVHLSNDSGDPPDDVHDQIFIGGATSTAKLYGIKKWTTQDFAQLDESMNLSEFHASVREKYS
jgi:hypothetical protein